MAPLIAASLLSPLWTLWRISSARVLPVNYYSISTNISGAIKKQEVSRVKFKVPMSYFVSVRDHNTKKQIFWCYRYAFFSLKWPNIKQKYIFIIPFKKSAVYFSKGRVQILPCFNGVTFIIKTTLYCKHLYFSIWSFHFNCFDEKHPKSYCIWDTNFHIHKLSIYFV